MKKKWEKNDQEEEGEKKNIRKCKKRKNARKILGKKNGVAEINIGGESLVRWTQGEGRCECIEGVGKLCEEAWEEDGRLLWYWKAHCDNEIA